MSAANKPAPFTVVMNEFDKRTTSDLAAEHFSGIRTNELLSRFEIWITGNVERTVTYGEFFRDPDSLTQAYCLAFGLKEATLAGAVEEAVREIEKRKEGMKQLEDTAKGREIIDTFSSKH